METRLEISFDELKNRSMNLYGSYCDLFKQGGNIIMLLAIYHEAFQIACHESADLLKSVKGKKTLSVGMGKGKFGNLIDFEIAREGDKFVATEPLFDCGAFAEGGFSGMDIMGLMGLITTYPPKLPVEAVIGQDSKSVNA